MCFLGCVGERLAVRNDLKLWELGNMAISLAFEKNPKVLDLQGG